MRLGTILHTFVCVAGAILLIACGGQSSGDSATGGSAGSGALSGAGAVTATGGISSGGGGTGAATGGTGNVGPGCAGYGGVGGMPPMCKDGEIWGAWQGPNGYCPIHQVCQEDTPLCSSSAAPTCVACPGTGGPIMVSVGDACVDSTEVTRSQYATWLSTSPVTSAQSTECAWNSTFAPEPECMAKGEVCQAGCDDHPQVCVDWCDAAAYCASVGKRLCGAYGFVWSKPDAWYDKENTELTEACNERGTDAYPYGPISDPKACNASELGKGTTVPVGSQSGCARSHGDGKIFDTVGNVWEWEDACSGKTGGDKCRSRGGSFYEPSTSATCMLVDNWRTRDVAAPDLGFRCCAS